MRVWNVCVPLPFSLPRSFVLTVKVGGAPATNTLDFQYDSPCITRITLQNQPCLSAVAVEGTGPVDDDSASHAPVRIAIPHPTRGMHEWLCGLCFLHHPHP